MAIRDHWLIFDLTFDTYTENKHLWFWEGDMGEVLCLHHYRGSTKTHGSHSFDEAKFKCFSRFFSKNHNQIPRFIFYLKKWKKE